MVNLTINLDREEDGRWIAEVLELPGMICYGKTRDEAICSAERLAIEVIADRIAHGELPSAALGVSFTIPAQWFEHSRDVGPYLGLAGPLAEFEAAPHARSARGAGGDPGAGGVTG